MARWFFGVTSALVTYGLVLQRVLAAGNDAGRFTIVAGRIVNTLSFFTVQSNILVAVSTGLLVVRLARTSTLFRVLRLTAVIGITITGVVFHLALANLQELSDKEAAADWVLHTASPILCVAGWLLRRGRSTGRGARCGGSGSSPRARVFFTCGAHERGPDVDGDGVSIPSASNEAAPR